MAAYTSSCVGECEMCKRFRYSITTISLVYMSSFIRNEMLNHFTLIRFLTTYFRMVKQNCNNVFSVTKKIMINTVKQLLILIYMQSNKIHEVFLMIEFIHHVC